MTHCWQEHFGAKKRKRYSYHDKEWAAKMKAIGLQPSISGMVGGKETGQQMSHYIIRGGPFIRSYDKLAATGWKLNLQSASGRAAPRGRAARQNSPALNVDRIFSASQARTPPVGSAIRVPNRAWFPKPKPLLNRTIRQQSDCALLCVLPGVLLCVLPTLNCVLLSPLYIGSSTQECVLLPKPIGGSNLIVRSNPHAASPLGQHG
jgi:hypothetical protein